MGLHHAPDPTLYPLVNDSVPTCMTFFAVATRHNLFGAGARTLQAVTHKQTPLQVLSDSLLLSVSSTRYNMQCSASTTGRLLHSTAHSQGSLLSGLTCAKRASTDCYCRCFSAQSALGSDTALRGCTLQRLPLNRSQGVFVSRHSVKASAKSSQQASDALEGIAPAVPKDLSLPSHCCGCGIRLQLSDTKLPGYVQLLHAHVQLVVHVLPDRTGRHCLHAVL